MHYIVITNDGQEYIFKTFKQARKYAETIKRLKPYIDQHNGEELTGTYWKFDGDKLIKTS